MKYSFNYYMENCDKNIKKKQLITPIFCIFAKVVILDRNHRAIRQ